MSKVDLVQSNSDLINRHNFAIAQYGAQIKYQEGLAEPDLTFLEELKKLYEKEKAKLVEAWARIKAKGKEFLLEVYNIVKALFEELVSDILAFLKKHGLDVIIEFIKGLF